jgi:hypothetical protein
MHDRGEALLQSTRAALRELGQLAGQRLEDDPYATVGTVFGFGLVLGGGLPVGVLRFTARAAAGIVLRHVVEAALPGGSGDVES